MKQNNTTAYTLKGLPLDLWARIKMMATVRRVTINELIIDILRKETKDLNI